MPGPIDYTKITIVPDFDTAEWWMGTKQGKYLVRQCQDCGHKWFPPFPACNTCNSMDLGWFETAGRVCCTAISWSPSRFWAPLSMPCRMSWA